MAFLYINSKGTAWRKHSYSAGNDFDSSPYKYYLRRVLGWKEKDNKARLRFGRALEEAVQHYHETSGDPVEAFTERWAEHEKDDLIYTKVERDWPTCQIIGTEMMRLYVIQQPKLPIPLGGNSLFQREYSREMFPGDAVYGEIEDAGKIDILSFVDPHHPALPVMEWKDEYGVLRQLITDIKTAAVDFPRTPGIAAFDKQLRRYSWLSGIRDVAILWFRKSNLALSKGCSVTMLQEAGDFQPGDECVVAYVAADGVWIVPNDTFVDWMDKEQGHVHDRLDTTKAAKQRKQVWLETYATLVPAESLTRQRIQFNAGRVSEESAKDAGLIPARQIKQIVDAWNSKQWPNTFGIRFPNDDTRDPYFRAFVLGDKKYQKENFEQLEQDEDLFMEDEAIPE